MPSSALSNPQAQFFRSWNGPPVIGAEVRSEPFSPPRILLVPFVGYPSERGIRLELECDANGRRLQIATGDAHEDWSERFLMIPPGWCPGDAQLVAADDSPSQYIGVGTPFAATWWHLLRHSAFALVFLHAVAFVLAALPLAAAALGARRFGVQPSFDWIVGIAVYGLVGYLAFFLFQLSRPVGYGLSIAAYAGCGWAAFTWLRARATRDARWLDAVSWRLAVPYTFSLAAVLLLEAVDTGAGAWNAAYRFAPALWSTDHLLPRIVAEGIFNRIPIAEILGGAWHVSDRPPLMSGMLLFAEPWLHLVTLPDAARTSSHYLPKFMGIVMASGICLVLVDVIRRSEAGKDRSPAHRAAILLVGLATPFVLFNTIYTWPKLPGAVFAGAAVLVLADARTPPDRRETALAGILFGLSLLSHSGVVFGLLAVPLAVRALSGSWRLAETGIAGVVGAITWLPWMLWQRIVDPPGNALLKVALTGALYFDARESVGDVVRQRFAGVTLSSWVGAKWLAVRTLWGRGEREGWLEERVWNALARCRLEDFLYVVPSWRFLGAGVVVAVILASRNRVAPKPFRTMLLLLASGTAGVAANVLVTWDHHIVHHQSYFSMLCLLMAGMLSLLLLPVRVSAVMVAAQAAYIEVVWIVEPFVNGGTVGYGTAIAAAGATVLLWLELRACSSEASGESRLAGPGVRC